MPIHREGKGWQWGQHGHVYPNKEGAEKQAEAAHAHGYKDSQDYYETETDAARAVRDGKLESPVKFGTAWIFDLRITGTGISIRDRDGKSELTYRPPEFYLNDAFLERCQGLPVIFEHMKGKGLNTEEYRNRSIGNIVMPYLPIVFDELHREGDVWGIARIYDQDAVDLMRTTHISTSPGVLGMTGGRTIPLDDKSHMLIEGNPRIIEHLACVPYGVWDKQGEPRGINLS